MTSLSNTEKTLADTYPQQSKLYLSIYEPNLAMMCQVSGSYDSSLQTVTYTNLVSGSYTQVEDFLFQVALIGTTPGGDEKGRTWVRSATNNQIRFVESDHINWANGDWITVLEYTEIIPVFPRIIQDPADEENVIFYKIYDVEYTNQNSILGTFICMGGNYAGFIDPTTNKCQVYWSASGSYNLLDEAITYGWVFEGATVTGSSVCTPGYIDYTTPGHYRTHLNITSASGRVDKSVRYVSIYNRPEAGTFVPTLDWHFTDLPSGSRESKGYKFGIRVRGNANNVKIRDGAIVVIFADEWYGNTKQSIDGNLPHWGSVKFCGYITDGTIHRNYKDNYIDFDVLSPTGIMELSECFSCSVESKTAPTTWYELLNMDCRRALYHYYAWQSTVLLCTDFEFRGSDRNIQFFDADRTSLLDAGQNLMRGTLRGDLVSDRYGKIWAERDYSIITGSLSYFNTALAISKQDMLEEPVIDEQTVDQVSFLEWGGIYYEPLGNTFAAYLCDAPGVAPRYHGKVDRKQGFALSSQDDLNVMAGQSLATSNARYPKAEFLLRANFSNLDIAPQELLLVTLKPEDTDRQLNWVMKPFANRKVDWLFNKEMLYPRVGTSEVVDGFPGMTVVIPDVPTDGDTGGQKPPKPPEPPPPQPPLTPLIFNLKVYDEHILVGEHISGLDIIGSSVYATVTGTVAFIIHQTGGGSTGTVASCHGYFFYDVTGSTYNLTKTILGNDYADVPGQETYDDGGFFVSCPTVTLKAPIAGNYAVSVSIKPNITFYTTNDAPADTTTIVGVDIYLTDPGNSDNKVSESNTVDVLGASDVCALVETPIASFSYNVKLMLADTVTFRIAWYQTGLSWAKIKTAPPYQPQFSFEANVYASLISAI